MEDLVERCWEDIGEKWESLSDENLFYVIIVMLVVFLEFGKVMLVFDWIVGC